MIHMILIIHIIHMILIIHMTHYVNIRGLIIHIIILNCKKKTSNFSIFNILTF